MSAHTPGPWVTADGFGPSPDGLAIQSLDGKNYLICECTGYYSLETTLANARLIAAAPDLLATLRQIGIEATESPNSDANRLELILSLARAAIAKAEGRA